MASHNPGQLLDTSQLGAGGVIDAVERAHRRPDYESCARTWGLGEARPRAKAGLLPVLDP